MLQPEYRLEGIVRTRGEEMEDFQGPLDVIFLLLSKNKIEIQNVSITAILEQYLAYLDEMKALDMEITSEFILMASHLMLIKTKMLLSEAERVEAQGELEQLRQSLLERQRREAMEQLRLGMAWLEPRNEIGRNQFVKQPEPLRREAGYRYSHSVADLLRALADIAQREERMLPPPTAHFQGIVGREPYPVAKKAARILEILRGGVKKFLGLFQGNRSRSEVVATFLAVLELCKTGSATLEGDASGEDITVKLSEREGSVNGNG